MSAPESPYLAFIVGLHVATALALLVFFWRDWVRIVGGFFTSIRHRRVTTPDERLAWLLILATIPVGITGLLLEHTFRTVLGRPMPAAAFLFANGVILLLGERLRRSRPPSAERPVGRRGRPPPDGRRRPTPRPWTRTRIVAADRRGWPRLAPGRRRCSSARAQILALLPGISRSGVTMVAGLVRGPVPRGRRPVLVPAGHAGDPGRRRAQAPGPGRPARRRDPRPGPGRQPRLRRRRLPAVRFLTRYFTTRTLTPFAIYCLIAGAAGLVILAVR